MKNNTFSLIIIFLFLIFIGCSKSSEENQTIFQITFSKQLSNDPQNGRLVLLLSENDDREPRFQLSDGLNTQLGYGLDVYNMQPEEATTLDNKAFGYPIQDL